MSERWKVVIIGGGIARTIGSGRCHVVIFGCARHHIAAGQMIVRGGIHRRIGDHGRIDD